MTSQKEKISKIETRNTNRYKSTPVG